MSLSNQLSQLAIQSDPVLLHQPQILLVIIVRVPLSHVFHTQHHISRATPLCRCPLHPQLDSTLIRLTTRSPAHILCLLTNGILLQVRHTHILILACGRCHSCLVRFLGVMPSTNYAGYYLFCRVQSGLQLVLANFHCLHESRFACYGMCRLLQSRSINAFLGSSSPIL